MRGELRKLGRVSRHHAFLHVTLLVHLGDGERGQLLDAVQPLLSISHISFATHHQRALEAGINITYMPSL